MFVFSRETISDRGLEGGEDPGDIPGGVKGVRRQPTAAQRRHHLRQAAVGPDGAAHPRQPELGDLLLAEAEEQEAAAVPRRDMGRRHEDIMGSSRGWEGARGLIRASHHRIVGCENIFINFFTSYYETASVEDGGSGCRFALLGLF